MTNVRSLRHRTVAPERSVASVVVYCLRKPRRRRVEASDSRSQIRGRDKSVLDDISPLPGTVSLRTVLRYAPFLEEWSTKHADARRNCDRLLTGSCTMDAWLAQCGFWRKVGEMQKPMVRVRYKRLTRLALDPNPCFRRERATRAPGICQARAGSDSLATGFAGAAAAVQSASGSHAREHLDCGAIISLPRRASCARASCPPAVWSGVYCLRLDLA